MQTENFSALASSDADAPGLEQPEGEQPEFDEGLGDPLPHAVSPTPTARRAASGAARRHRRRPLLDM
jgi:hypothetical protein